MCIRDRVDELQLRDVEAPVLIRFPDILDNRIEKIANCFKQASDEYGYKAQNFIIYPIKVNQMRPVVEEIVSHGNKFNIGLDWPFIAGRAEIWACANVLAPIMLIEAVLLSKVGNGILPLAGIIAMGVTPALLVVTRGKLIRMIIFGSLLLPLFLLSGTLIAPFATQLAKSVDAFPKGVASTQLITHSTLEGPVEKLLGWTIGNATTGDIKAILGVVVFLAFYIGIFAWYRKQMIKRNEEYAANAK